MQATNQQKDLIPLAQSHSRRSPTDRKAQGLWVQIKSIQGYTHGL